MISAALALAAVLAAQTAAPAAAKPATAAKAAPMAMRVEASPNGGKPVEDWAKELRTALEARKDEFRPAAAKEKAEFVVRLDSIGPGTAGNQIVKGELALGEAKRPFTYSFTSVRADAEKLARNLRPVADQMKATGK
jgi:ABC-type phosphate transport system substrate-binding protein